MRQPSDFVEEHWLDRHRSRLESIIGVLFTWSEWDSIIVIFASLFFRADLHLAWGWDGRPLRFSLIF